MLQFDAGWFAIGGLAAASGPMLIHLLNRRRFRPLPWAAMDFLRDALRQQRRALELRDLVLLMLRLTAVIAFGIALARPFFAGSFPAQSGLVFGVLALLGILALAAATIRRRWSGLLLGLLAAGLIAGAVYKSREVLAWTPGSLSPAEGARQPVHAILLVDNSRSMGAQVLGESEFDRARQKASRFIADLPAGSRTTILPITGSVDDFPLEGFRTPEDARRALERLTLTDMAGPLRPALELARQAGAQTEDQDSRRYVLITDLQQNAWDDGSLKDLLPQMPELQIAATRDAAEGNVWISHFELEDGIASQDAPARFLARIAAAGAPAGAMTVTARLKLDGLEVASQTVQLSTSQERELEFPYQFDQSIAETQPAFVVAELELECDTAAANRLLADDREARIVPVVAELPVVFVDQFGADESAAQNRIGETAALRHLLVPRTSGERGQRRLVQIRHVRPDAVDRELLQDARLVVVGGVSEPGELASLLREYVEQGGPLLLLAGGDFDARLWQDEAWRNGAGILPAPLLPEPLGRLPEDAPNDLQPFFVDFTTLQGPDFLIEQEDPQLMAAIFESTPFFKAVRLDASPETVESLRSATIARLEQVAATAAESDEAAPANVEPVWWRWRAPATGTTPTPAEQSLIETPRVLASFTGSEVPFAVERRIGLGRVVMFTSGVTSDWNLLRQSGAMYVFHRTMLRLLRETLPQRNYATGQRIALPRDPAPDLRLVARRPDGVVEPAPLEAISGATTGILLRRTWNAGVYAVETQDLSDPAVQRITDETRFAAQGPSAESDLSYMSPPDLQAKLGIPGLRVLAADASLTVAGSGRAGRGLWKFAAGSVLAMLLSEMGLLALWSRRQEQRT